MRKIILLLAMLLHFIGMAQTDTATIMYYNVLNYPGTTGSRVQYFRTINQYAKPDLILITELVSDAGAQTLLNEGLNVYGETKYQKALFINGDDTDNMLFYNSNMFSLFSQDTIDTELRAINEYVLYYNVQAPVQDTIFFYLYVAHLKSSTGTENVQQRLAEVIRYKSHVNGKPNIENMIFGGDLNLYTATEPAYTTLINTGLYPLHDVLPAGNWHDNETFAGIHTQSPRTVQFGGGANGGLDDRFDFMLFTEDLLAGTNNIQYINNSCIAFGNDGQHLNKSLLDLPVNTTIPDSVIQAIYYMSDHLPVLSKFTIQPETAPQLFELSLKVFLEGPFTGAEMNTGINSVLPLTSPYNQPPWNYQDSSSVSVIPYPNVVDWILVELRDAPDAPSAHAGTIICRQTGFLLSDGSIKGIDGISNLQFNNSITHQLFIVIYHRNHLGVMSALPPFLTGITYSYDYTTSTEKAYLNGQKQLTPGVWGMFAGDSDANGHVNEIDKSVIWNNQAGLSGYLSGDCNFDSEVDHRDKNEFILINHLRNSNIPE